MKNVKLVMDRHATEEKDLRAVAYSEPGPVDRLRAFIEMELPSPKLRPRDLLVRVKAASVNVVDTKLRRSARPKDGDPRVLGFDAAGVVEVVGKDVALFKEGDEVFYAGKIASRQPLPRPQHHRTNVLPVERLSARRPRYNRNAANFLATVSIAATVSYWL